MESQVRIERTTNRVATDANNHSGTATYRVFIYRLITSLYEGWHPNNFEKFFLRILSVIQRVNHFRFAIIRMMGYNIRVVLANTRLWHVKIVKIYTAATHSSLHISNIRHNIGELCLSSPKIQLLLG